MVQTNSVLHYKPLEAFQAELSGRKLDFNHSGVGSSARATDIFVPRVLRSYSLGAFRYFQKASSPKLGNRRESPALNFKYSIASGFS